VPPPRPLGADAVAVDCDGEPVADAFMVEPLPYRSAVADGATHVIVLRTRPDPCPVLGKVRCVGVVADRVDTGGGGGALL